MRVFGTFDPAVRYTERIAAYVVIYSVDGCFAAVQGRTAYFLPGGGREDGETPEQTVRREVREELGRDIQVIRPIGQATQYFFASSDDCHYEMQATFFTAEFVDEEDIGESLLHWVPVEEAPSAFFHECHAWAVQLSDALTNALETPAGSVKNRG